MFHRIAVIAVLGLLAGCSSEVEVEALDGTVVVIELDPEKMTDWPGPRYREGEEVVASLEPDPDAGRGNEANMIGTTDR